MPDPVRHEFDSFWKQTLDHYLQRLIRLVAPDVYVAIDWGKGFTPDNTELLALRPKPAAGKRIADALVRVHLKAGGEAILLIHVEVAGQQDTALPERMFVYRVRLRDRYGLPVLSIAVLADDNPEWRPSGFFEDVFGSQLRFVFPVFKLLDLVPRLDELEASADPILFLIAVHLRTLQTRPDEQRLYFKTVYVRALLRSERFSADDIVILFRLLDLAMALPEDLEIEFNEETQRIREEEHGSILSNMERRAMKEVRENKSREVILRILRARFGPVPEDAAPALAQVRDPAALDRLIDATALAASIADFQAALEREVTSPPRR